MAFHVTFVCVSLIHKHYNIQVKLLVKFCVSDVNAKVAEYNCNSARDIPVGNTEYKRGYSKQELAAGQSFDYITHRVNPLKNSIILLNILTMTSQRDSLGGTGLGSGVGLGVGSGVGSGTGSGTGSGVGSGSGVGKGTGSGTGTGVGSGVGVGAGSGAGSGAGIGVSGVGGAGTGCGGAGGVLGVHHPRM